MIELDKRIFALTHNTLRMYASSTYEYDIYSDFGQGGEVENANL